MECTITFRDLCLPDYVLDHCNGERERLIGVLVDNAATVQDVAKGIRDGIWSADYGIPEDVDIDAAIAELVRDCSSPNAIAFPDAPAPEDDCGGYGDSCYAWFRVSW